MKSTPTSRDSRAGFSLLECMIAIVILTVVMAGIFMEVNKAQTYYRVEDQKVDFTAQQRAFIDQFTRDLHQAGFPTPVSLGQPVGFNGILAFTPTSLTMQGDLGDGNGPSTVTYTYNAAAGTLQRSVGGVTTNGVENVIAANFTGYDISGNPTAAPTALRSVRITFSTQGGPDASGRAPIQITMTGMARLPNNN